MKHLLLSALVLLTPRLASAAEAPPAPAPAITGAVAREVRAADGERIPVLVLEPHQPPRGPAPVAVLVHGLTRSKEDWLVDAKPTFGGAFTEALRGAGYRVYLFDARLHGARAVEGDKPSARVKRSHEGDSGPYRSMVAGTTEDAHAVLAHALEGDRPTRVLLGGYSMGSQVALLLAAYSGEVEHSFRAKWNTRSGHEEQSERQRRWPGFTSPPSWTGSNSFPGRAPSRPRA